MKNLYFVIVCIAWGAAIFMACRKTPDNNPVANPVTVVAGFNKPSPIYKGVEVTFTNTSTGADAYAWKVNGVDMSTAADLKHIFTETGTFEITLIATKGSVSATKKENVTVELPPLQADFTWERDGRSPWAVRIKLAPGSNADSYEMYFDDWVPVRTWSGTDTVYYIAPKDQAASAAGHNYSVKLTARRGTETKEVTKTVNIKDPSMRVFFPVTPGTYSHGNTLVNVSGFGSEYGTVPSAGVRLGPDQFNTANEALVFGSTINDELRLPQNYLNNLTIDNNAIAVSFFVKFSDLSDGQFLLGSYKDQTTFEKIIFFEGNKLKANWPAANPLQNIPEVTINDNQWHHIVFLANVSAQALYVDGNVSRSQYNVSGTILGSNKMQNDVFGYGLLGTNYWRQFRGSMDNIRFFNRVLTFNEIGALRGEK